MARLTIFLTFLAGLAVLISLGPNKKLPVQKERFSLEKAKKSHADLMKLSHPPVEKKKKIKKVAKKKVEIVPLTTEQLKRGFAVYTKKGKCVTCHGKRGEGKSSQKAPRIGGQHRWYLLSQLKNMKAKIRYNAKMNVYLKNLNEKDFQDVSEYLSKIPW